MVEVPDRSGPRPDDRGFGGALSNRGRRHRTLRYAHETNDCSLQQQYDQPMAAVHEQQLERALAEIQGFDQPQYHNAPAAYPTMPATMMAQ